MEMKKSMIVVALLAFVVMATIPEPILATRQTNRLSNILMATIPELAVKAPLTCGGLANSCSTNDDCCGSCICGSNWAFSNVCLATEKDFMGPTCNA
ncbi:hypothetical protein RND81_13G005600 [Saponaria officinalis]|uniref:Uncharacterized protein n=1 Tax=Saponaria officinalis TaxID=3572 RepID=A0AAW1GUN6_SAPOF